MSESGMVVGLFVTLVCAFLIGVGWGQRERRRVEVTSSEGARIERLASERGELRALVADAAVLIAPHDDDPAAGLWLTHARQALGPEVWSR